jgi:simple sugar transport system permease protein
MQAADPDIRPAGRLAAALDQLVGAMRGTGAGVSGLLVLLAALVGLFTVLLPAVFLRPTTLQAMMFQLPELGLLSLAMVIPLVSGGINLAIVATANQAGLLMAWILTSLMPPDASGAVLALWLAGSLAAGLVLCKVIGLITGVLVAVMGVHPILVTLGTMTLINGSSIYFTRGRTLSGFPEPLIHVSNGTVLGIPISFMLFVVIAVAVHVVLTRTPLGIRIHMIGSNLEATRFSGVDTRRALVSVYLLSSLLCWVAAIVMMARFNSAGADIAQSYLLITILAAILGGIDPYGGFGRIAGLFVALCILQVISSGFNLLGLSPNLTLAFWGLILLAVMGVKRAAASWRDRHRTR